VAVGPEALSTAAVLVMGQDAVAAGNRGWRAGDGDAARWRCCARDALRGDTASSAGRHGTAELLPGGSAVVTADAAPTAVTTTDGAIHPITRFADSPGGTAPRGERLSNASFVAAADPGERRTSLPGGGPAPTNEADTPPVIAEAVTAAASIGWRATAR